MANNSFIYDGALAGATGGIHERWITDNDPNSYLAIRNLLVNFAEAVDALIAPNAAINSADGDLIQSICESTLSQRYLTPETDVHPLAQAIVALYQAIQSQLIPVPYPSSFPLSAIEPIDPNTVVANPTAVAASPVAMPVPVDSVVGRVSGTVTAGPLVTSQISDAAVTLPKIADQPANSIIANPAAIPGPLSAFIIGLNSVLGRVAGNLVAAQIVTAQIALLQITNALLAEMNEATVKGRPVGAGFGPVVDLSAAQLSDLVTKTWAQTLAAGHTSGPHNPTVDAGQYLGFGPAPPTIGLNETIRADGNLIAYTNASLTLVSQAQLTVATLNGILNISAGGAGGTINLQGQDITLTSVTTVIMAAATFEINATGIIELDAAVAVAISTFLRFQAQIASTPTLVAGQGMFWVQVGTPTLPKYTNSANADFTLATLPVPNADLAPMAANTIKANPTAALTTPQDFTVPVNSVVGRVAGNLVAALLVTAQIALNQITNALLATMNPSTLKGRAAGAGIGDAQDLTPTQIVAIIIAENIAWTGNHSFTSVSHTVTVSGAILESAVGDIALSSSAGGLGLNAGHTVTSIGNGDVVINASSGIALTTGGTPATGATIGVIDLNATVVRVFTAGVERLEIEADGAWQLAGVTGTSGQVMKSAGNTAPPSWQSNADVLYVAFASGGGGTDDVVIFNGNAPFAFRILDVTLLVSTPALLSTCQLRNATGGGGAAVSSSFGTTVTGTFRNSVSVTSTIAANGTLVLRRSDSNVVGEVMVTIRPT